MSRGTMTPNSFTVSVLLHQDGDAWVAQCLQKDLVAQGRTEEEAKDRFLASLGAQIAWDLRDGVEPLAKLSQAPERFFHDSVRAGSCGPELPVFVPVTESNSKQVAVMAQFLKKAA
jgi:hypothetical protein